MKELKKILRALESMGFTLKNGEGSRLKVCPPNPAQPFYSLHFNEKAYHPFRRFARNQWKIDITELG